MTLSNDPANSRFFHAMVLMGGSLALGCGGVTSSNDLPAAGAAGSAAGGTASGGAAAGGASTSSGGTGIIFVASGGAATVTPGPFACPPPLWDCRNSPPVCQGDGFGLPDDCACDRQRPGTPADCAQGQTFVCRSGSTTSDGRRLTETVPFECSCVPDQLNCGLACDLAFVRSGSCVDMTTTDTHSVLCDCAVIVLR